MIKNENIICISSIDWDFIWQGHQEIMSTFAKNGNKVLFIENTGVRTPTFKDIPRLKKRIARWFKSVKGFRKESENLFIYSPVILPFPYSRFARWVNRHMLIKPLKYWMKAMNFHRPIVWTFLPTGMALDIINEIDKKLLVYYYIADFDELTDNSRRLKATEGSVMKMCDLIFAQGRLLEEKAKRFNKNVHIFPFGVNAEVFEDFSKKRPGPVPRDLKDIKKPIIGYVGGIHKHIDFGLLKYIAETHPERSIVLVGPAQTDVSQLEKIPNVVFLGKKDFSELPAYINLFDACIIPYRLSEYTKTVYPTKLNEYHIMGKPVVSTELPEIKAFNRLNNDLVAVAGTNEEFDEAIERAIRMNSDALAKLRVESARRNSWSARISEMSALMEQAMKEGKHDMPVNWQEKFLALYKNTRKGILTAALTALTAWLLVFYTPIVWLLAEPLKIAQAPQKAGAIVVLAGGVGESGKAGQGYEERVEYSTKLYREGYAQSLIFSSGYMYVLKEPLIMKLMATSLGVPEQAIILEDKAKNTYENIKYVKDILDEKGIKKVLLVSSPYHMLRVSLVARKIAPGIEVICTPIPYSRFYSRDGSRRAFFHKQITVQQIIAIAHEYAAILLYKIKGYC